MILELLKAVTTLVLGVTAVHRGPCFILMAKLIA